jgi:hypothetical protein
MGLSFDTTRDPLYLQVIAGRFGYAEVDAHFSELEAYCAERVRREPGWRPALFADARFAGKLDARGRRRISESFGRLGPLLGERMVAHAVVVQGKIGSGVLTAVLWVQRPPWQIQAFAAPDDAYRWLIRRHFEERLPPPPHPQGWWEGWRARSGEGPARR